MSYKAVIFDMDGTILNTLDDLRVAMNYALEQCGHRADWPNSTVRLFFGSAVDAAIRRALAREAGASEEELLTIGDTQDGSAFGVQTAEVERIKAVYMPYYAAHCNDLTGAYAGIPSLIRTLHEHGIRTAVVSNKPDAAVQTLADEVFPGLFDVSIGERAGVRRKPAPDMTMQALETLGVTPMEAVYIGDTEIDMQTAENADLPCICVTWGFRSRAFLVAHGAAAIVDRAEEILPLVLE